MPRFALLLALGSCAFAQAQFDVASIKPTAAAETSASGIYSERFRLAVHHETRPLRAYVIEAGKNGPKIEKTKGGGSSTDSGHGTLVAVNTTMDMFALVIAGQVELPFVNKTGLEGGYDFKLKWTPERELSQPDAGPVHLYCYPGAARAAPPRAEGPARSGCHRLRGEAHPN
jgi:uncharacterized protein (TIGR03435 family)